ncbi:MAG: hypothetical protein RBT45_05335, partial [Acholeplasmataceae bacterium]|nr:hypothetical protein [Acholeplasmataceae bacterium]
MRKISLIWILMSTIILLFGCEDKDYTEELDKIMTEMIESIPVQINSDFTIPVYDDVEISLTLNQKRYLNKFIYESPFHDENVKLDIELKKGNSTLKQSMDVLLISSDSGRNNHRIDITVGIPVTSITKDTYVDAEIV